MVLMKLVGMRIGVRWQIDELDAAVDNYIGLKEKMFKEVEENA